MANKRMFNIKIVDSDAFLDMPLSTQCLYFHLNMRADDDGFVGNPKRVQRIIGATDDDLKLLMLKRFILAFDKGVIVIKHWRLHNTIQSDRYTPTTYIDEKGMLKIKENKAYSLESGRDVVPQEEDDIPELPDGQPEEGTGKKKNQKNESSIQIFDRLLPEYAFHDCIESKMREWLKYKMERKESYKEQGLKSLMTQVAKKTAEHGESAICNLIDECMANNWKGIIWDRLKQKPQSGIKNRVSEVDNW